MRYCDVIHILSHLLFHDRFLLNLNWINLVLHLTEMFNQLSHAKSDQARFFFMSFALWFQHDPRLNRSRHITWCVHAPYKKDTSFGPCILRLVFSLLSDFVFFFLLRSLQTHSRNDKRLVIFQHHPKCLWYVISSLVLPLNPSSPSSYILPHIKL